MAAKRMSYDLRGHLDGLAHSIFGRLMQLNKMPQELKDVAATRESAWDFRVSIMPKAEQDFFRTTARWLELPREETLGVRSALKVGSEMRHTVKVNVAPGEVRNVQEGCYKATFRVEYGRERPGFNSILEIQEMAPDHPLYEISAEYVKEHLRYHVIVKQAIRVWDKLSAHCRTPGQWGRVFPQALSILPSEEQHMFGSRKKNSPWPGTLNREQIEPKLPALRQLLTQCVLLPDNTNITEVRAPKGVPKLTLTDVDPRPKEIDHKYPVNTGSRWINP